MSLLGKFFKKKQNPSSTNVETSSDGIVVRIVSDTLLSEESVDVISSIVRNGIASESSLEDIGIQVLVYSGLSDPIILNKIKGGIEVIV